MSEVNGNPEWDEHHFFFPESKFLHLPYQVYQIFRGKMFILYVRVMVHQLFHGWVLGRDCVRKWRGLEICEYCPFRASEFCGLYFIRRAAARCPELTIGRPKIQDFPCVAKLISYYDQQGGYCMKSVDCRKRGHCLCGACHIETCPNKRENCDPDHCSSVEVCHHFVSFTVANREVSEN